MDEPKYILQVEDGGVEALSDRPTQEEIKSRGVGVYRLHRGDGTLLKQFRVVTNRNGNAQVVAETPDALEGLSTLNLNRMIRDYTRIVKLWPAQQSALRKIQAEVARRDGLVKEAAAA